MRGIFTSIAVAALIYGPAVAAPKPPPIRTAPPKVQITVTPSPRVDERFGDWRVMAFPGRIGISSVTNDGGFVFGSVCTKAECVAYFNPKIVCEKGARYPGLVNAPDGAFGVTMTCEIIDEVHVYTMPLEGGVADAMSVGGVIGIAFPMLSGQFQVARFSLTGAARASARAAQLVNPVDPPRRREATDNSVL